MFQFWFANECWWEFEMWNWIHHKKQWIFNRDYNLKERLNNYWWNTSMKMVFINTEYSQTNEPHKFILNLSQRLDLRSSDKHVPLQNLSIYYTWKNIRKQYKNNNLKIIGPTWIDEFELPDHSYSVLHV